MNRIKELRKAHKLSQQKLASILNVHQTAVSQWETGRTDPDIAIAKKMADLFNTTTDYIFNRTIPALSDTGSISAPTKKAIRIPVLGYVAAGIPIDAIENILDYEELDPEEFNPAYQYFALKIKGDSMMPRIQNGDVVIIRQQPDVENGEIAIVLVNGDEATIKKIQKSSEGIALIPLNPQYEVMFYTNKEIETLPVSILGKVIELRAKF